MIDVSGLLSLLLARLLLLLHGLLLHTCNGLCILIQRIRCSSSNTALGVQVLIIDWHRPIHRLIPLGQCVIQIHLDQLGAFDVFAALIADDPL